MNLEFRAGLMPINWIFYFFSCRKWPVFMMKIFKPRKYLTAVIWAVGLRLRPQYRSIGVLSAVSCQQFSDDSCLNRAATDISSVNLWKISKDELFSICVYNHLHIIVKRYWTLHFLIVNVFFVSCIFICNKFSSLHNINHIRRKRNTLLNISTFWSF